MTHVEVYYRNLTKNVFLEFQRKSRNGRVDHLCDFFACIVRCILPFLHIVIDVD